MITRPESLIAGRDLLWPFLRRYLLAEFGGNEVTERSQKKLIDPICGMRLDSDQVAATYIYLGQEYSFCSIECHDMFDRTPEHYVTHLAHEINGHWGHRCPNQR